LSETVLLDTCALIWIFNGDDTAGTVRPAVDRVWAEGGSLLVSPISGWEIGMLVSKGRLRLSTTPLNWFQRAIDTDGVALAELSPAILVESSFLPSAAALRDPTDRIVAATARALGHPLMTRDRLLLDYAEAGHMRALPC
jgi:PIN domain nuclease of toxin-antitoxin system